MEGHIHGAQDEDSHHQGINHTWREGETGEVMM